MPYGFNYSDGLGSISPVRPLSADEARQRAQLLKDLGLGDTWVGKGQSGYADALGLRDAARGAARDYAVNGVMSSLGIGSAGAAAGSAGAAGAAGASALGAL